MLKLVKAVSNTRVSKDEGVAILVSPTEGLLRLTRDAQAKLGVTDINRIAVIEVKLEDGSNAPAIYVSPYVHVKDANGKIEEDAEGKPKKVLANENAPEDYRLEGRKLGYPNGNTGSLQFSCASSWSTLGGTAEGTKKWLIKGFEAGEEMYKGEGGGISVYALVEDKDAFKKKGSKDESED